LKAWAYNDFKIEQLFDITTTKRKFNANDVSFNGRHPYVVRTSENNGIRGYIEEDEQYLNAGNTISFGQDTATIFYQEKPYFTGDKIKILTPKFEINAEIASYFLTCMRKSFSSFQWGVTSFNVTALNAISVSLPVNKSGEIDFAYMQDRIQEMEQDRIQEMDAYLKVAGFEDCELTEEEKNAVHNKSIYTRKFVIGDLFDKVELRKKPFDKRKDTRQKPDCRYCIPLVNAKHGENGIMYYGDSSVFDSVDMTIDIVQNGAIATGDVYPQPQQTGVLWDAYLIRATNHQDNVETLLYFSTAIEKSIKKKYSYDNKAYWEQVKENLIDIPVTPSGQIDYKFMETYIRAQEKLAIQRVKNWREKEIEATKEIVYAKPDQATQQSVSCYIISSSDVTSSQKYITHLPVYPLRAACGYFDANGSLPEEEAEGWIDVSAQMNRLDKGMFIVYAEGKSMEPKIHDGDLCVFNSSAAGSRQGKIVLVKARDISDPSASSFTIKKYSSKKVSDEDNGWRHTHITLSPLNANYRSIEISAEGVEDGEFKIYGEFVQVINAQ